MKPTESPAGSVVVEDLASAVNSVLRITATLIIYLFHCHGLYGRGDSRPLFYAFAFFLFLSGYYAMVRRENAVRWIRRRLRRIYIPYWLVITVVVLSNWAVQYKPVGVKELFFLLIGGNLFIEDKLYVIAWFISVIIFLYCCVFLMAYFRSMALRFLLAVALVYIMSHYRIPVYFYVAFTIGWSLHYLLLRSGLSRAVLPLSPGAARTLQRVYGPLLTVQNFSYEFFLVHGGVLLLFNKLLKASYGEALYAGIAVTMINAMILKELTRRIELFIDGRRAAAGTGGDAKRSPN
ncbi:acyltransferase family protein [Pseudodesulfovibrio mercurii]|nr:acyltransferase family protein [Pseudodesulfovibrio mercurii]